MNFKVSKFRFLINESIVLVLVSMVATILDLLINGYPFICAFFGVVSFLFFLLKIDWYGRDELYIKDKYIKLERTKVGGNSIKPYGIWKENSDSSIEKIEKFKETLTKIIVYGDTNVNTMFSNEVGGTEHKRKKKRLVIRKNFKDMKKIREMLNDAVNSN